MRAATLASPALPGGASNPTIPRQIMDIKQLKTPLENTAWIDGPEGAKFHIRSTEAPQYRQKILALGRQHQHRIKRDPKLQQELTIQTMAESILIGWEGVTDNGAPLPCTPENKKLLLEIPEIRDLISTESQDLANFRLEAIAAEAAAIKSDD